LNRIKETSILMNLRFLWFQISQVGTGLYITCHLTKHSVTKIHY